VNGRSATRRTNKKQSDKKSDHWGHVRFFNIGSIRFIRVIRTVLLLASRI